MRISIDWLQEYLELAVSPPEVATWLTQAGLEVERIDSTPFGDVLEISLTPNLNHCASVRGVARELACLRGMRWKDPVFHLKEAQESTSPDRVTVRVVDREACPRYLCREIHNVRVAPSPQWLRDRLETAGIRSVNNVVDATNYVLMELGHPLHAFDLGRLQGKQVTIGPALEGERIRTLDGKERVLQASDLTIRDASGPIALAGVMGGERVEVQEGTRDIFLESAYFSPRCVRKTSKRLALSTDASRRYERGADPNQLLISLDRAADLIQQVAGGNILQGVVESSAKTFLPLMLCCRLSRIQNLMGVAISRGEVENILQALCFQPEWDGQDVFIVHIPTFRADIHQEIDVIEEIIRFYGFDNLPKRRPSYTTGLQKEPSLYRLEKQVRQQLLQMGLQEFLTCHLVGPSLLKFSQQKEDRSLIQVLNPTSLEQSVLRNSLLPGLVQVVKHNGDHQIADVSGFEIGKVYFQRASPSLDADVHYREQVALGMVFTGRAVPRFWGETCRNWDFFALKGVLEELLLSLQMKAHFAPHAAANLHPERQAVICVDGLEVGSFGEVHPAIQKKLDVSQKLLFAELSLEDLLEKITLKRQIALPSSYPSSERDWTVSIRQDIPFARVEKTILSVKPVILSRLFLLDLYTGSSVREGYHNMTIRFVYQSPHETLAQARIDEAHANIQDYFCKIFSEAILS